MAFPSSTALSKLPFTPFLTSYPFPAFILIIRSRYHSEQSLNPVYGNPALRNLLFGPDADTHELNHALLESLGTVEQARKFGVWVEQAHNGRPSEETLELTFRPLWASDDSDSVILELVQTVMDEFLVCTSTPKTSIPIYLPTPPSSQGRPGRDFDLKLNDLPKPTFTRETTPQGVRYTSKRTPSRASRSSPVSNSRARETKIGSTATHINNMREYLENFDWESTPLGKRENWPANLRTVVSYMLRNPYPSAIWWGPEVVLLYNDAYAELAGTKHPAIFGQRGSVSWGEIWATLGPISNRVFQRGETVSRRDELLFFNRLTEAKLPEETYNTWYWIPIENDDGSVAGMVNVNFETTHKVIAERRLGILRDLSGAVGQAKSQVQFADAILGVLENMTLDAPFAAFYFASVEDDAGAPNGDRPRTSYLRRSMDDAPVHVELNLAGTVAIPKSHPSAPTRVELLLDPVSLRPVAQSRTQSISTVLSSPTLSAGKRKAASVSTDVPMADASPKIEAPSLDNSVHGVSSSSTISSLSSRTLSAATAKHYAIWPFAEAFGTRQTVHVPHIPAYVMEGYDVRGWGEYAREAVVIPLVGDDTDMPRAFLILGLNTRRPYDTDYAEWVDLTRVALNALLKTVKGREDDVLRADQLAALDHAKTVFFSNASHELRTPLTLIQGPLQDAIGRTEDPKAKENLKLAQRNVSRLNRLVDALMDFSRLAANKLEGRFKPVQLGALTADLASLFRSVIEKSNITYTIQCDTNERKLCYVDTDFWEKIVFNLIGNAFKYTLRGSIDVIVEYDRDSAHFHVKDTGVGIPQPDLSRIFERFYRVDATSRCHEGTGLGLALTKELVKLHGGKIDVQSVSEQDYPMHHGTTFTVSLPLGREHLPSSHVVSPGEDTPQERKYARGVVDEAHSWSHQTPSDGRTPSDSSDGGSSDGSRIDPSTLFFVKSDVILLVDDNADMRRYIRSIFVPFCKVIEAGNGQEALEMLDEVKANLILSDVMMPVLDGYGLISALRQRPDTKLIPIILLTAKESEEARIEGLLSGADDYLCKPFNAKEMIARVHLQMQLGKRRAELEERFMERAREIQLLSDLSPVGIVRADIQGHVIYVNTQWWEISGHDRQAPIDNWPESVMDDDVEAVYDAWASAVERQASIALEFRFKNGRYAKGHFEPLFIADPGESRGVIATITDVSDRRLYEASRLAHAQEMEHTARKRAEDAEERRKEADERRRGQELLIDVTSHELRQPVSAILNCSHLVRANLVSLRELLWQQNVTGKGFHLSESLFQTIDEDIDSLEAIYQCGLAQERIANDVLSLSRIQLQVLSIHPVEFDVENEVRGIVAIFRNETKMKDIKLALEFGNSLSLLGVTRVSCDKLRFGQVITNLLSNAIKFTDTSRDRREIMVSVDVTTVAPPYDGPCIPDLSDLTPLPRDVAATIFIFVSVTDSGPGLRPEDLTLLFKRFAQGSNSDKVFGGSGLGLFVSRNLCELMNGRIDVRSVYGQGATFSFYIEAVTVPDDISLDNSAIISSTEESARTLVDEDGADVPPAHILITEDNIINQTVLNRQLMKAGFTTSLASNGEQAIEQIRSLLASRKNGGTKFDTILMDCEMPVMDGMSAVREIRKLEASGEFPYRHRILALTGNAREGQVQSALDAGMDDVIIKPYKPDELLAKLQNIRT